MKLKKVQVHLHIYLLYVYIMHKLHSFYFYHGIVLLINKCMSKINLLRNGCFWTLQSKICNLYNMITFFIINRSSWNDHGDMDVLSDIGILRRIKNYHAYMFLVSSPENSGKLKEDPIHSTVAELSVKDSLASTSSCTSTNRLFC